MKDILDPSRHKTERNIYLFFFVVSTAVMSFLYTVPEATCLPMLVPVLLTGLGAQSSHRCYKDLSEGD